MCAINPVQVSTRGNFKIAQFWITDHYTWKLSKITLLYLCNVLYLEGLLTTCVFIDNVRHYVHNFIMTCSLSHDIMFDEERIYWEVHPPTHALFAQLFRWPYICESRHFLIFCFVSQSEGLYWHTCSFGMHCLLMNMYKAFN